VNKVAEHLDLDASAERVLDEPRKVAIECGLTPDELHHLRTEADRLVDHARPVLQGHRPIGAPWAGIGIAVHTLQLTFASDFQPHERNCSHRTPPKLGNPVTI
jgi:hypothetical protein